MERYFLWHDGAYIECRLYSLREYEADGGCYAVDDDEGGDLIRALAAARGIALRPAQATGRGLFAVPVAPADWPRLRQVVADVRARFIGAFWTDAADPRAVLEAEGLASSADAWHDTLTDYYLLATYPASAPLSARVGLADRPREPIEAVFTRWPDPPPRDVLPMCQVGVTRRAQTFLVAAASSFEAVFEALAQAEEAGWDPGRIPLPPWSQDDPVPSGLVWVTLSLSS